jgi:hypothetical protein
VGWWDGPMYRKRGSPRNRTRLSWGIESQRSHNERWAKMTRAERAAERKSWRKPQHRAWNRQRGRALAEMVEGVSPRHDQEQLGLGPFGRGTRWLRWKMWT